MVAATKNTVEKYCYRSVLVGQKRMVAATLNIGFLSSGLKNQLDADNDDASILNSCPRRKE